MCDVGSTELNSPAPFSEFQTFGRDASDPPLNNTELLTNDSKLQVACLLEYATRAAVLPLLYIKMLPQSTSTCRAMPPPAIPS